MNLSSRLKEVVRESERPQYVNAELCGISLPYLNHLMNGYCFEPSIKVLMSIARHFDVSTDWLLGISDTRRRYGE